MAENRKGAAVGALLAIVLLAWACDPDDSPTDASGESLTVRSAETFADITLSDGRRVHNTEVDSVAHYLAGSSPYSTASDEARNTCIVGVLNRWAVDNLVGRQVGEISADTYSSSYNVAPMAGYNRARVYFVNGSSDRDNMVTELGSARADAYAACSVSTYSSPTTTTTTTTPPPTTTSEAPVYVDPDVYVDTDPDVYVDADSPSYDSPRSRTGNSGHLCLPGERDGDGDGYCGEGR